MSRMQYLQFCKTVVRHEFGELIETVLDSLLAKGAQSVHDLVQDTEMEDAEVKKALLRLVQHGIVQPDQESRAAAVYRADPDAVRCRLRFPKYVEVMKRKYGMHGWAVMSSFVRHGRLTLTQMLDMAGAMLTQEAQDRGQEPPDQESTREQLQEVADSIARSGYILLAERLKAVQRAKRKKAERALAAAAASKKKRKGGAAAGAKKKRKTGRVTAAEPDDDSDKEDDDVDADDDGSSPSGVGTEGEDNGFWVICHKRFLADFRKQAIVDFARDRMDNTAATVVRIILDSYPNDPNRAPPAWDARQILRLHEQGVDDSSMTMEALENILAELCTETLALARCEGGRYLINVEFVFEALQQRHAQSVIKERYGLVAARIFKLLCIHRRLEEKQVSELATTPKKTARSVLYELLRGGFVCLQDVPRTADRHPARTFYLWGVPKNAAKIILMDDVLFAWVNLRTRLNMEYKKIAPLLDKLTVDLDSLSDADRASIERWKAGNDRMNHGLATLGDLITMYLDFCRAPSDNLALS